MISLHRIKNILIFVLGFVLVTKTYVVFSYYLSLPMSVISGSFFLLCIILITLRLKSFIPLFSTISGIGIFAMVIIGPLLATLCSLRFDPTFLFLQFFYISIVLVAIGYSKELHNQRKFLLYGMYFNLIVGAITMAFPDLLQNFSKIVGAKETYYGRAVGFYLQPNGFGLATILIYILSSFLYPKTYIAKFLFPCAFTVLITGSRSSLVIFIAIIGLQYAANFLSKRGDKNQQKKIMKMSMISLGLLTGMIIIFLNSSLQKNQKLKQLTERLEFYITAVQQLEKLDKDQSANDRDIYQNRYKERIAKNPVFGYGFGIQKNDVQNGVLIGSSHNEYLSVLYQGGILYLSLYLLFILCIIITTIHMHRINYSVYITLASFTFYIILYGFLINTMFNQRLIYLFLGLIVASQYNSLSFNKKISNKNIQ